VADVKILGIPGSLRQASFNRFALRAASMAVFPPPYTTTRRPTLGGVLSSMLLRKLAASRIFPASRPGISVLLARCAPIARKAASYPPSRMAVSRSSTL